MKTSTCRRVCLLALISFVLLGSVLSGREEIVLAEEITVAPRQAQEFSFPVQDGELRQIRLSLDVRLDWGTLGRYTSGISIAVNGQKVAGKRLLNKPLKCRLRNGSILQWADQDGTGFIVMYAGNFSDEILTNQHYIYGIVEEGQDPFRFVFDLSGLTTHNIDNKIVVSPNHSVGLVLANVKVEFDEAAMPRINDTAAAVIPAPEGDLPDFSFYTPKRHSPALKKADDGILIFEFHGHDYPVAGRFSLPDGNWCEAGTGSGMWRTSAQPQKMVLTTNSYRLIRKVKIREGYVKITDTFENLTDAVVGIIFANSLHLPEIPQRILRGGKETELKQTGSNSNPSIVA